MKTRSYTIYSIVVSLLEEAALVAIVLWGLPEVGTNIPLWGLIALMVALGVCCYVLYEVGRKALRKRPSVTLEALIGSKGEVVVPLAPQGYVKIGGELWKALSNEVVVNAGEEVLVVGIKGLVLSVSPLHYKTGE